ncbi:MFS transporter [Emergencia timonensis]|uniref:MFS transporter n=1 Tax=Emergencia timonensis TaxID=1776384 RepID=UPI0039944F39
MSNNKRWLYLGVGTILLIFCGLIYGWSLFKEPFGQVYPDWSLSQLSMTFTISMVFFCLGGFVAGKLSAKLKPRYIIMISGLLLLIGFFGVSRLNPENSASSLTMLYVCYGVLGGTGVGFSYNSVISTMNKWFPDKPGLASGIMMMGFGLGALILGSVATSLVASKGVFTTFMILGIIIFVVLVVGSLFIKNPEAPKGEGGAAPALEGMTTGEMLKTSSFWIFIIWCIIANSAGLMVINSAASIAIAFGAPAIVGMVVSVFNGAGRVIIGGVFDKLGRKNTMLINMVVMAVAGVSLFFGAKTSAMILILLGLLCMGISYGGNPTISSAFINREYGPKHFPVNFSLGNFSLIPAAILGPMISSKLVESAGGKYDTTFLAIIICAAGAFVLWIVLNGACGKDKK